MNNSLIEVLDQQVLVEELASKEWLVSNGLGGYASSTLSGCNTRRYHGLLIASFNPPTDRRVLVSKIEERIQLGENTISLSTNKYPGVVAPTGYQWIENFERAPLPCTSFRVEDSRFNKTVFMVHGSNTTVVEYENVGPVSLALELTPLYVFRDYHGLFRASDSFDFYHEIQGNSLVTYAQYGADPLYFSYSKGNFSSNPDWFFNFEYVKEKYRGMDSQEDAKSLGQLIVNLAPGEKVYLTFSTERRFQNEDPKVLKEKELERLGKIGQIGENKFLNDLRISGDQFLVNRKNSQNKTLIAGYHWFTDWGRDTMIAMRGLTISVGNKAVSESLIRTFLLHISKGMIPNRFPDLGEEPEYNTIDATLWLFIVLYEYHEKFHDAAFLEEVFPKLTEILDAHKKGTRYNVHVTEEGLLYGGEGLAQLTWMDARVGDYVVTPRHGCPVEINALWYNALCIYYEFGNLLGKEVEGERILANKVKDAFRKYFLNPKGYLNDVVIPDVAIDSSIRPNQIYAISLPFSVLKDEEAQAVLRIVDENLYTDLGLRSLVPTHPEFKAIYKGDQFQRDSAYHQGTVWAFLWGEFALAYLKVHAYSEQAITEIHHRAKSLQEHFYSDACLHGISEIFDGLDPKEGRGCINQAWSIGMLLKVYDVMHVEQAQPATI